MMNYWKPNENIRKESWSSLIMCNSIRAQIDMRKDMSITINKIDGP
jgi:hypothetical protein